MGFRVSIETDYGTEVLCNYHPEGKPSGGKAVFAFLTGLSVYSSSLIEDDRGKDSLRDVYNWYKGVETQTGQTLFPSCTSLIDCMWGDGGDPTVYREDEYAFYVHRSGSEPALSETEFIDMVRGYDKHWQPIKDVIAGVDMLLKLFKGCTLEDIEGFYEAEHTIPDFEALLANLNLLLERENTIVRLNFR